MTHLISNSEEVRRLQRDKLTSLIPTPTGLHGWGNYLFSTARAAPQDFAPLGLPTLVCVWLKAFISNLWKMRF
ncbi:hypothetical protein FHS57_002778 [Runella defluvii]|uniref:Uncharacterized protein n=1 Tax=Runella defluvii TaxID=370973 RepID=A0A7W6EQS8_9BACT|nr:hypothetical protein [Runella defluvii]